MAVFIVLMVYLTITGHISGQEMEGNGLQLAVENVVKNHTEIAAVPVEKPDTFVADENLKVFGGEESADVQSSMNETKPNMNDLENKVTIKTAVKVYPKSDLEISEDSNKAEEKEFKTYPQMMKKREDINEGKHQMENNHRQKPSFRGSNKIQKVHSKKAGVPNKNQKGLFGKHQFMKKSPPKAAAKSMARKNHNFPNGGKVVFAKLPQSLLLNPLSEYGGHHNQMKKGGNQMKKGGSQMKTGGNQMKKGGMKMRTHENQFKKGGNQMKKIGNHIRKKGHQAMLLNKPLKNVRKNNHNQLNVKKAWKIVKGQ